MDLGNTRPNFQGQRDEAQGPVEHQYERFDTARNSDPSADLSSSTFRPDMRPEEILETQRQAVEQQIRQFTENQDLFMAREAGQPQPGGRVRHDVEAESNKHEPDPAAATQQAIQQSANLTQPPAGPTARPFTADVDAALAPATVGAGAAGVGTDSAGKPRPQSGNRSEPARTAMSSIRLRLRQSMTSRLTGS